MRTLGELNDVYDHGDHINDDELEHMISRYEELTALLTVHSRERWHPVFVEAMDRLEQLKRFRDARRNR